MVALYAAGVVWQDEDDGLGDWSRPGCTAPIDPQFSGDCGPGDAVLESEVPR